MLDLDLDENQLDTIFIFKINVLLLKTHNLSTHNYFCVTSLVFGRRGRM